MSETETALAVVDEKPSTILPVENAAEALSAYRKLQKMLDEQLDDCLVTIQGKKYRTKSYWRAVAAMYNLDVEIVREERVEADDDWTYIITTRATAPNGRHMDGDGCCSASEKRGDPSIHNVRSHAVTRSKNRATADLCGFGEVTAEEMPRGAPTSGEDWQGEEQPLPPPRRSADEGQASEKQLKWLTRKAIERAEALGYPGTDDGPDWMTVNSIKKVASQLIGVTKDDFPRSAVDAVAAAIDTIEVGEDGHAITPEEPF